MFMFYVYLIDLVRQPSTGLAFFKNKISVRMSMKSCFFNFFKIYRDHHPPQTTILVVDSVFVQNGTWNKMFISKGDRA